MKASKSSILILLVYFELSAQHECNQDKECAIRWPESTCKNGRCRCPMNFVRRASTSRGWVCLSLQDAVTGQLGPPITCPLPSGAGYRLVLKKSNSSTVFCNTQSSSETCGDQHECIRTIGVFNAENDGVCCPRQKNSCDYNQVLLDDGGWLPRWHFNGKDCVKFMWSPDSARSANTYLTKQHCQSYCQI